jgi:hypothetical protein
MQIWIQIVTISKNGTYSERTFVSYNISWRHCHQIWRWSIVDTQSLIWISYMASANKLGGASPELRRDASIPAGGRSARRQQWTWKSSASRCAPPAGRILAGRCRRRRTKAVARSWAGGDVSHGDSGARLRRRSIARIGEGGSMPAVWSAKEIEVVVLLIHRG